MTKNKQEPAAKTGKLYLIPVDLGNDNPADVLPQKNMDIVALLDEFIVENVRSARRFLRATGYTKDFETVKFHLLDKHTPPELIPSFMDGLFRGKNMGLLSEAGNPCIADPGNLVVKLAHEKQIQVVPLVGPSSILLGLIASGFNGQSFTFHGYLPVDRKARISAIKELQYKVLHLHQTQIFMETPYRNNALLKDILENCQESMLLSIACNITREDQFIQTMSIGAWKKQTPDLHKKPGVFLLYKEV